MEKSPLKIHTTRDIPGLPVCASTPVGDMKIPDPIILPTITVIPLNRVIFGLRPTTLSSSIDLGGLSSTDSGGFCATSSYLLLLSVMIVSLCTNTSDPNFTTDEEILKGCGSYWQSGGYGGTVEVVLWCRL